MRKKKIAFINQRYGLEVNGGSEQYTRMIAEKLSPFYDVDVLTTTAISAVTWKNEYPKGVCRVGPVTVHRFPVEQKCKPARFDPLDAQVMARALPRELEYAYIKELGPYSPKLIEYVSKNVEQYDLFIVVTYLYYLAVHSLPLVGKKAIFIPTAHDEGYIYLSLFIQLFRQPARFLFLTDQERYFVQHHFQVEHVPFDVLGTGVNVPSCMDPQAFCQKHGLSPGNYLIYAGRIEGGKECPTLFSYFQRYKRRNPGDLKLVFMGKEMIPVPKDADMLSLGFVSEEEKFSGMAGALALVMPSRHESLSIVVLESMAVSTPVIVNAACDVLRGHCLKSDAGLFYRDYHEFEACVNFFLFNKYARQTMRENASAYIDTFYQWPHIIKRLRESIEVAIIDASYISPVDMMAPL